MALSFGVFLDGLVTVFRRGFAYDWIGVVYVRFLPILAIAATISTSSLLSGSGAKSCSNSFLNHDAVRKEHAESICYSGAYSMIYTTESKWFGYYDWMPYYFLITAIAIFAVSELFFQWASGVAVSSLVRSCKAQSSANDKAALIRRAFNFVRLSKPPVVKASLERCVSCPNVSLQSPSRSGQGDDSGTLDRSASIQSFHTALECLEETSDWMDNGHLWQSKQRYRLVGSILIFKLIAVLTCVIFVLLSNEIVFRAEVVSATWNSVARAGGFNLTSIFPLSGLCDFSFSLGADPRREILVCSLSANSRFIVIVPMAYSLSVLVGTAMLISSLRVCFLLAKRKATIVQATARYLSSRAMGVSLRDIEHFALVLPPDIWLSVTLVIGKNDATMFDEIFGIFYTDEKVFQLNNIPVVFGGVHTLANT